MALNSANVGVAVTGEIGYADVGTTLPASASASKSAFTGLGYISTDGIVENNDVSRDQIKAMQNAATVREIITDATTSYDFTLIETTVDAVELYYGTSVTRTSAHGTFTVDPAGTAGRKAWVIDVVDGAEIKRIEVAEGEVFKGDGVTYANGEAIAYSCHLVAYTQPVVFDTRLKTGA